MNRRLFLAAIGLAPVAAVTDASAAKSYRTGEVGPEMIMPMKPMKPGVAALEVSIDKDAIRKWGKYIDASISRQLREYETMRG